MTGSMPHWKKYLADNKSDPWIFLVLCVDVVLRGIAQVFLCDHPISGILILVGLMNTSYELAGYALLGTLFSTIGSIFIATASYSDVSSGLCGYVLPYDIF